MRKEKSRDYQFFWIFLFYTFFSSGRKEYMRKKQKKKKI